MKAKKIPFNIRYEQDVANGKYNVVCGDDCVPVRVVCWDADERYPVVAIDDGIVHQYSENGVCCDGSGENLYLVQLRSEFNEALITFYENYREYEYIGKDAINANADILYGIARAQVLEELGLGNYDIVTAKEFIEKLSNNF